MGKSIAGKIKASKAKASAKATVPHLIVEARAGTGKSTTLIEGLKKLKGIASDHPAAKNPSDQQRKIWESLLLSKDAVSVAFVAFNTSIANELKSRVPAGCDAMTSHSLGNRIVSNTFGRLKLENSRVQNIVAEILKIDIWELRRNKMVFLKATEELVDLCKQNLVDCSDGDWDELARLADYYSIELDRHKTEVFSMVPKVLERCKDVSKDKCISFADMIWLPVVLDLPVSQYDLLLVDEAQDLNRCQQALMRKCGKRLVLCGDPKQCFPAGTMISVEGGITVPIEKIVEEPDKYRLVAFSPADSRFAGRRTQGRRVEATHTSKFSGDMVRITASSNTAICTPNHKWWVRFAPSCKGKFCLYLMEKMGSYRVGICKMQYSCGMGVASRARSENADKAWILQIFDSIEEARMAEELTSVQDGLPQLIFNGTRAGAPSQDFIDLFYTSLGNNQDRAEKCLRQFDRDMSYPIWEKQQGDRYNYLSVTEGFVCNACNLIDGCFQVRIDDGSRGGRWCDAEIDILEYDGLVYGLTVEPTERGLRLYTANNIVTHNSIYGFAGADAESLSRMYQELNDTPQRCELLPLNYTRRCGKAIVAEANKIVPDFYAFEDNSEGDVSSMPMEEYRRWVKPGDMVLCRVNAPLVSECFRFLKAGRKAVIQGRDVGAGLIKTIRALEKRSLADPFDVPAPVGALAAWLRDEEAKELAKPNPSDTKLLNLQDRHDCLQCFCEDAKTVQNVIERIEAIFTDAGTTGILLSSVHKAKGLEARRVFILMPEGAGMPHPLAKSAWEKEQERHLLYVATTRAIEELVYVR